MESQGKQNQSNTRKKVESKYRVVKEKIPSSKNQ